MLSEKTVVFKELGELTEQHLSVFSRRVMFITNLISSKLSFFSSSAIFSEIDFDHCSACDLE
jgi:hypothetical protein